MTFRLRSYGDVSEAELVRLSAIDKPLTLPYTPTKRGTAGAECDKCCEPERCKRIEHCVGYRCKFGTWRQP